MLSSNQRSAIAALDAARPVVARLDVARHPDDLAADLIESWSAVETALRSLLGGSSLTGQALVSEVRQRGLLDYGHAHALLGFLAARDRVSRTDYRPTEMDADAARAGFQACEAALGVGIGADTATYPAVRASAGGVGMPPASFAPTATGAINPPPPPPRPPASSPAAAARNAPPPAVPYEEVQPPARRGPGPLLGLIGLLLVVGIGAFLWLRGGEPGSMRDGEDAYRRGDRVAARRSFEQAATDRPKLALPHVYLARMARQDGDLPRAFNELKTAVTLEPDDEIALREMGQYLLQANQPGQAVTWFTRALKVNQNDRAAQGWMGCALIRQGQADIAGRFYQRAGSGDWSACQQAGPPAAAPGVAPGAVVPNAMPAGTIPPGGVAPAPSTPRP